MSETRTYTPLVCFDDKGYPSCEKHGAMLCVEKERRIWRCPTCNIGADVTNLFLFLKREHDAWLKAMK